MTIRWFEQSLADVSPLDDWLSPWERSHLSRLRVPKRRADWRLGRWTAKYAVADCLGFPHVAKTLATVEIRPEASGAPDVFIEDVPGNISISLSHSGGVAACALGAPGMIFGCDLELVEPRTEAFVADYFTPDEQEQIRQAPEAGRFGLITLIWSAKESALKALRTGLRSSTLRVSVALHDDVHEISFADHQSAIYEPSLTFAEPVHKWHSLDISHISAGVLHGCWFYKDPFVRTIVCTSSACRPQLGLGTHPSAPRGLSQEQTEGDLS